MSKLVFRIFFGLIFLYYVSEKNGSEMLRDITSTNEGKVTNPYIIMGSFSSTSRKSLESPVSLFLFSMNFVILLTSEWKSHMKYDYHL